MRTTLINISIIGLAFALTALVGCTPKKPSVAELRRQKAEQDSLSLIAQQRSLVYYESMRDSLLPVAQTMLKKNFVYEKSDRYEDYGHYVHRLLKTNTNATRCFMQVYATDNYELQVKAYLAGSRPLYPQRLTLSSGEVHTDLSGVSHSFESEGWHETLTLDEESVKKALCFIDGYQNERILATVQGSKGSYKFYLSDRDKQALIDTYALGQVMQDIHQLETQIHQTNIEIEKYEHRIHHRS